MADEASLMFQVQSNDVDSEEEDEIIRKQELQKLLSEELQDDLLDSSEEEEYEEDNCTLDCESSQMFYPSLPQQSNNVLHLTTTNDIPVKQINNQNHVMYKDSNGVAETIPPVENQLLPVSPMNNAVDVFNGTSQEYSLLNQQTEQLNGSSDAMPVYTTTSEYSHLDRLHLEALYTAKSRQLKDMETEVKRIISENERKCGVLRHQVKLLEGEKQTMSDQMTKLQSDAEQLAVMVRDYQLKEEPNEIVRREQQELKEKLSSSQTTINLLTSQLNEMSSTDVLQKIRQNYESLIATSSNDHKRQVEELEQSVATLEKELQEMKAENDSLVQGTSPSDQDASVKRERELEEDKRKLIAEVEDLTFQLNTVQEELSSYQDRTGQLQQALCESERLHKCTVEEMHSKQVELNDSLEKLKKELSSQKTTAEAHLKTCLEHCRSACLQLHEDSTEDLKREFNAEREKIEMQYKTEINRLRHMIGKEKEKSRKETEEALQEQIDTTLSSAHEVWKVDEEKRLQGRVQNILRQASKDQERKVADAVKKKEADWAVRYRTLREETERSRQKSEADIAQLNKKLSKVLLDKSVGNNQQLVSELKSTLKSLQNALVQLISQTLICFEEEKMKQLKEVRQLALKEAEAHYLSCLHALVNKK